MITVEQLLMTAKEQGASDVHITVGVPPKMRVNGELLDLDYPRLMPDDCEKIVLSIMNERQLAMFKENGELDFSFSIPQVGRYRVNVFRQRGSVACAMRIVGTEVPKPEQLGVPQSVIDLYDKKRAWWLNTWQILIDRCPGLGERIKISTWPYGFKGIYGYRNFTITDLEGNYLVRADSCWFFYDLENNCPARVTQDEIRGYGAGEQKLELPPAPRKIVLPKDCQSAEPVTAARHHIDTNQHVNNAQYVEIARELLPEKFTIRELRTEYKKAAVLGDVMYPKIGKTAEGYVVSLQDAAGNVLANIWLAEKREDE